MGNKKSPNYGASSFDSPKFIIHQLKAAYNRMMLIIIVNRLSALVSEVKAYKVNG
jgi:hypothetical protein